MARTTTKPRLSDLILDAKNANRGTKRGRALLNKSLKELGAGRSILIDKNRRVIAGNKSLESAKAAGIKKLIEIDTDGDTIVAVRRIDLDLKKDKKAKELAIVDNRSGELNLEWDDSVLTELSKELDLGDLGFLDRELKALGLEISEPEAPEPKIDQAAELQKKWKTARGQIWEIGKHRLMCGDTRTEMPQLLGKRKVACVVTSPPYGVGLEYASYEDTAANCRELITALAAVCGNTLLDGGFAVINFGDIIVGRSWTESAEPCEYPTALDYWPAFRSAGFTLWARRIWVKYMAPGLVGPWTASTNRAAGNWEHVWTWKKAGKPHVGHSDRSQWAVIDWRTFEGEDSKIEHHPGYFPAWFAKYLISIHSVEGDAVLEPFIGTGSTMCAAADSNRICYGMEISEAYTAVALERLSEMGLKPKLVRK